MDLRIETMKILRLIVFFLLLCARANAGTLVLTPSTSGVTVNLTAVGTLDWVEWSTNSLTPLNHMSGGAGGISVTNIGTINSYSNDPRTITWFNGTPNANGSETSGIYNAANVQFSFSVPTDTIARVAYFYLSLFQATTTSFACSLSDASASPQSYGGFTAGGTVVDVIVQVNYSANSASQTMTCTWNYSAGSGSVNVQAVAVTVPSGPSAIWPPVRISSAPPTRPSMAMDRNRDRRRLAA